MTTQPCFVHVYYISSLIAMHAHIWGQQEKNGGLLSYYYWLCCWCYWLLQNGFDLLCDGWTSCQRNYYSVVFDCKVIPLPSRLVCILHARISSAFAKLCAGGSFSKLCSLNTELFLNAKEKLLPKSSSPSVSKWYFCTVGDKDEATLILLVLKFLLNYIPLVCFEDCLQLV